MFTFPEVLQLCSVLVFQKDGKKTNNYLDDFFFAVLMKILCDGQIHDFIKICDEINFPLAPEKMEWGTTVIVFLGILINTVTQTIAIPVDERDRAVEQLQRVIESD